MCECVGGYLLVCVCVGGGGGEREVYAQCNFHTVLVALVETWAVISIVDDVVSIKHTQNDHTHHHH